MAQEVIQATLEVSTNSLKVLREEIKGYRAELEKAEIGTDAFDKASKDLAKAQSQLKNALTLGKKEVSELDTSYDGLVRQMAELRDAWKKTSDVAERDALGKQIAGINTQLKDLDGSIGNFQRNVGDYQGKIIATGKKAGETLAKTVAPALQENVTLVFDWAESLQGIRELWSQIGTAAIAEIKAVTSALRKSGWGAIILAVVAAVAALIYAFHDAEEAVVATVEKMSGLKKIMMEIDAAAAQETVELRTLYETTQDLNQSYDTRLRAAEKLQDMYPDYLGKLSTEEILAGKAADSYQELALSITAAAKAQAAMGRLMEIESLKLSAEYMAYEKSAKEVDKWRRIVAADEESFEPVTDNIAAYSSPGAMSAARTDTRKSSREHTDALAKAVRQHEANRVALNELYKEIMGENAISFDSASAKIDEMTDFLTMTYQEALTLAQSIEKGGSTSGGTGGGASGSTFDVKGYLDELREAKRQREADTFEEEVSLLEDRYMAEVDAATRRLELAKATEQEISEAKLLIEEEYLIKRKELFVKYYGETAEAVAPALEQQTTLTFDAAAAEIRSGEVYNKTERGKQKTARKTGEVIKDMALVTLEVSKAGAAWFEENTIAHKAFSAAQATIDAFRAANSVLADLREGPSWVRWATASATLAIGLANVKSIFNTPTDGSAATASAAVYNAPAVVQEVPVTRTVTGEAEEEQIRANNQVRVVLVYGDVEEAANRVQVQQSEASF